MPQNSHPAEYRGPPPSRSRRTLVGTNTCKQGAGGRPLERSFSFARPVRRVCRYVGRIDRHTSSVSSMYLSDAQAVQFR
jgi:hypothetical protein